MLVLELMLILPITVEGMERGEVEMGSVGEVGAELLVFGLYKTVSELVRGLGTLSLCLAMATLGIVVVILGEGRGGFK
jgi:hypothetical protein